MTTSIRHLNTTFADDPTELARPIAHRIEILGIFQQICEAT